MVDLDRVGGQSEFADLIGVSQQAVSAMISRGVLVQGATLRNWLISYCGNLREQAAGRASTGDLDLVQERARTAKEQADKLAMQNAVTRRELAPVFLLEQSLANICRQISGVLEAIPVNLKRRVRNISTEELEFITREINQARNLAASVELNLEEMDDGPERDHEGDQAGSESAES